MLRATALLALLPLASCTSCVLDVGTRGSGVRGSGVNVSEERPVPAFDHLVVAGGWRVDLAVGGAQRVQVECDDNLLPLLETVVEDGTLTVRFQESVSPRTTCRLTVEVPALAGVRLAGGNELDARGLDEPRFELVGAGSTRVSAHGRVDELVIDCAGASELDLLGLEAKRARVHAAGSADVRLDVAEELDVDGAGSVSVRYRGDPRTRTDVRGAGSVRHLSSGG